MERNARYFKIIEIDQESFIRAADEDLDCSQLSMSTNDGVYAAVDEDSEDEIRVDLDLFD